MKKKVLFIDRDGTLVIEPPVDYQLDSFKKLEFYPKVINALSKLVKISEYDIVMVTNQDGLGTDSFPESTFWPVQNFIINTFKNEGINFKEVLIDRSFPEDNLPTRKPGIAMMSGYLTKAYDLENSYVIGDRLSDMELAKNLGSRGILIGEQPENESDFPIALVTKDWEEILALLTERKATVNRKTNETKIGMTLNLDGEGRNDISTGLAFFDHMLEQIARHASVDLFINVEGDLEVDEHHTIEDTAIVLGEAFSQAIGSKLGMQRYGYCLPMDDCLAQVAIDFGGRNWIEWEATFNREMIGKLPTEMFFHFFKSFSDGAKCNLNIQASGNNEHHKIEAIFKAFARAIRKAIKRDLEDATLPSTKGVL